MLPLRSGAQSSYIVKYFEGSNADKTTSIRNQTPTPLFCCTLLSSLEHLIYQKTWTPIRIFCIHSNITQGAGGQQQKICMKSSSLQLYFFWLLGVLLLSETALSHKYNGKNSNSYCSSEGKNRPDKKSSARDQRISCVFLGS